MHHKHAYFLPRLWGDPRSERIDSGQDWMVFSVGGDFGDKSFASKGEDKTRKVEKSIAGNKVQGP